MKRSNNEDHKNSELFSIFNLIKKKYPLIRIYILVVIQIVSCMHKYLLKIINIYIITKSFLFRDIEELILIVLGLNDL